MQLNRYYKNWTSEDGSAYRLEIIPSHSHTDVFDTRAAGGFNECELPDDFVLKEMTLESDAGEIPLGLHSKTLRMSFNLGYENSSVTDAVYLRDALLKGTFNSNFPMDSSYNTLYELWTPFECFNTFILYKSGSVIFIGCQKFSAENELEVTKLSPVIRYSIEAFDIIRCIGEMIRPEAWTWFLKTQNVLVDYGLGSLVLENKEYKLINIAKHFYQGDIQENYYGTFYKLEDRLTGDMAFTVQTFKSLSGKIANMIESYMRAILVYDVNVNVQNLFDTAVTFFKLRDYGATPNTIVNEPAFISEIISTKFNQNFFYGQIIGGALVDEQMFGQFKNFYEVLKSLIEGSFEQYRFYFGFNNQGGGMGSDYFTLDFEAMKIAPINNEFTGATINQGNVFDSVKFKLFQETLNTCNVTVSSITGEADTESWSYSKQATSGDNSKDIKIMFHNIPLLTYRNVNNQESDFETETVWFRNTINSGTICYLGSDGIPCKVDTACQVSWTFDYWFNNTAVDASKSPFLQILTEQQKSGLPYNISNSIVQILGAASQKILEFRTTVDFLNSDDLGLFSDVAVSNLAPVLGNWGGSGYYNKGALMKHSLDIWSGMADVTLRIHGMM